MSSALSRLRQLYHRFRGRSIEFDLGPYEELLAAINARESDLQTADDDALKGMSTDLVTRARGGVTQDDLLIDAFALVREAARRTIGLRPFDVQIIAGLALHRGRLAEMQTGEGKTLAAVLPAYLNALTGRGVHILTFNDYLARRDAAWMGPIYTYLGLTVASVQEGTDTPRRQAAYASDITYVTAKEAGFDYLRDHLCYEKEDLVHRPFHVAIVDEADSVLIDEARVPLVIAGGATVAEARLSRATQIVRGLDADSDFSTDEYSRNVYLTDPGLDRVESLLGCGSLHDPENLGVLSELNLALHAKVLLKRDVDYIVRNERVELVDEFTGRVVENRRWPDGLQAAVEVKEELRLQPEGKILGSITLQHLLKLYPRISGMTATAQSAAEEFNDLYGMNVTVIPPNRPCIRIDHPDVVFTHKEAKTEALVEEIARVHATGRPILVGTSTVAESEHLASALRQAGVACETLNAKNDELEAAIIARAGSLNAVTISTNMAGRGTDIRLGGDHGQDREKVVDLGGLYVIGTNRHESLRIDSQLRGRAGRQGDPGETRFFVSLEDDLIERYGIQELIPPKHRPGRQKGPIDDPVVGREIARAQRIIESQTSEIRKTLWRYSSLVEDQRKALHHRRQEVLLESASLELLQTHAPDRYPELRSAVGHDVLRRVEKQITLCLIDRCWAEHLDQVAHIREGIHLVRVGGQDPLDEFHKRITYAFGDVQRNIDNGIVQTFNEAEVTEDGIDVDKEGLKGPTSTWTYLVSDNPFGNWLDGLFNVLKNALAKESG